MISEQDHDWLHGEYRDILARVRKKITEQGKIISWETTWALAEVEKELEKL